MEQNPSMYLFLLWSLRVSDSLFHCWPREASAELAVTLAVESSFDVLCEDVERAGGLRRPALPAILWVFHRRKHNLDNSTACSFAGFERRGAIF